MEQVWALDVLDVSVQNFHAIQLASKCSFHSLASQWPCTTSAACQFTSAVSWLVLKQHATTCCIVHQHSLRGWLLTAKASGAGRTVVAGTQELPFCWIPIQLTLTPMKHECSIWQTVAPMQHVWPSLRHSQLSKVQPLGQRP